jgi:hypothetical protein
MGVAAAALDALGCQHPNVARRISDIRNGNDPRARDLDVQRKLLRRAECPIRVASVDFAASGGACAGPRFRHVVSVAKIGSPVSIAVAAVTARMREAVGNLGLLREEIAVSVVRDFGVDTFALAFAATENPSRMVYHGPF